jgi:hypothetical protein
VVDYVVAPATSQRRLRAARSALLVQPAFGATAVRFEPFTTSDVRFTVDRPVRLGSAHEDRTGVALLLQGGLKDTLVMAVEDFGLLFQAMQRRTASLFLGQVSLSVPGATDEVIPFVGRFDDLAGDLFLTTVTPRADRGFDVHLVNAIESPLAVDTLSAALVRDDQSWEAAVRGTGLPVASLAPGTSLDVTVDPPDPAPPDGPVSISVDLDHVRVLPDPKALLDCILDRTTLQFFDIITVQVVAGIFAVPQDRPGDQIISVIVAIEGGGSATLDAIHLSAPVRIDYPIDDVLLGNTAPDGYTYLTTVVRADGREHTSDQQHGTGTELHPTIELTPPPDPTSQG